MEENLGTGVLVFNLTTCIQEYLTQYSSKKEEENEFKKIQKEKEEEKERLSKLNRFVKDSEIDFIEEGNPVTLENFAQWKLQFDKENLEKKEKKENKKLTGREIFEQKVKWVDGVDPDSVEMFDDDLFLE
jgi:cell division protein FtsB